MFASERLYVIGLVILFMVSSFLPTSVLLLLDQWPVRIGILLFLLYAVSIGPTVGIFGFMVVGILLMERNRRKMDVALRKLDQMDPQSKPLAPVDFSSTLTSYDTMAPVAPSASTPPAEGSYVPADDSYESTNFEPVAPSINQKEVLRSMSTFLRDGASSAAAFYEEMGVGHITSSH